MFVPRAHVGYKHRNSDSGPAGACRPVGGRGQSLAWHRLFSLAGQERDAVVLWRARGDSAVDRLAILV